VAEVFAILGASGARQEHVAQTPHWPPRADARRRVDAGKASSKRRRRTVAHPERFGVPLPGRRFVWPLTAVKTSVCRWTNLPTCRSLAKDFHRSFQVAPGRPGSPPRRSFRRSERGMQKSAPPLRAPSSRIPASFSGRTRPPALTDHFGRPGCADSRIGAGAWHPLVMVTHELASIYAWRPGRRARPEDPAKSSRRRSGRGAGARDAAVGAASTTGRLHERQKRII